MNNYDVIVIGGGLTGSVLSYELAKNNFKVLLLDKDSFLNNATTYSYGGISYWCGTDKLTNQLCEEAINIYRNLGEELSEDIEFRELDLLFTINPSQNINQLLLDYQKFYIKPQFLNIDESISLEPLFNPDVIAGCLRFPQGHVNPLKMILAYQKNFIKLGGKIKKELVISVETNNHKIKGVKTNNYTYSSEQVIICAGAFSRQLLVKLGLNLPIYFSHAQLIKTLPSKIKLRTLVMPCTSKRLDTEKKVTDKKNLSMWQNPNDELQSDVEEAGAIQFLDGSFCLGQISQIITNIDTPIDAKASERRIRKAIAKVLPSLSVLQGTWHTCQVAFSQGMPFQGGKIKQIEGLSIFSGFTSPFVFVPPLARHFAHYLAKNQDSIGFQVLGNDLPFVIK
ncbi:FAD-dependent oxidoreductase [Geminocystis sp. GBBB08]|uniref:NAD(P)/FAD-dependent oxidoreductase n=1 Tax=Geminocystis sp. GBBB08 TaxID=2604140 RepID=UPI0027E39DD0|nr:FAD-dependent oxidoreductase [Geminocystis sp. GBBB08]MBL1208895.1 FAD-binding oxidoreductase [Geminocystis sp. GBBB08]